MHFSWLQCAHDSRLITAAGHIPYTASCISADDLNGTAHGQQTGGHIGQRGAFGERRSWFEGFSRQPDTPQLLLGFLYQGALLCGLFDGLTILKELAFFDELAKLAHVERA